MERARRAAESYGNDGRRSGYGVLKDVGGYAGKNEEGDTKEDKSD